MISCKGFKNADTEKKKENTRRWDIRGRNSEKKKTRRVSKKLSKGVFLGAGGRLVGADLPPAERYFQMGKTVEVTVKLFKTNEEDLRRGAI